jgi:3-oxoacyl-[acyl-carrier-protein] synthase-3
MRSAAITGWGVAVPDRVVTNADLAASVSGIDAEWIVRRSGIRERRYAGPTDTTSTLATSAGQRALERAGLAARDVDLVIVATCTPDHQIPATAPLVQAALGATKAGAFDVNAACAGFLTSYAIADSFIRAGAIERALVIGAEVLSRFVDWDDPKTCVLFGDGAGAMVLEASDAPAGLLSLTMGAAGESAGLLKIPAGGSARPTTEETLSAREHVIKMNGPEVYRAAVRIMSTAAQDAMTQAGIDAEGIDLLIAHQANNRIITEVGERLRFSADKVFSNVERYGNTSAASIPIAICDAADRGLLFPGARFVLTAVGAGLAWAAGVAVWTTATTIDLEPNLVSIGASS